MIQVDDVNIEVFSEDRHVGAAGKLRGLGAGHVGAGNLRDLRARRVRDCR